MAADVKNKVNLNSQRLGLLYLPNPASRAIVKKKEKKKRKRKDIKKKNNYQDEEIWVKLRVTSPEIGVP